ncbi:MAG TPA: sigma-70 family RNA polymerase sigma factor [Fimbriimonas sp.]|nr:sigma-70 family RNA polymerase sigma factor [Fimbriimonas sp.]
MELCIGATGRLVKSNSEPSVEAALIEKCRRQDFEAFGKLVDAYQNRVFGFVKRMVPNAEEAADITQEVFIRAFQNFTRFDGRSSVRTWLFRIAYHLCVDRARKVDRTPIHVGMTDSDEGEEIDVSDTRWQPDQLLIDSELMEIVEQGILTMSEKLRSVLLLHDKEDMQYDEIADMLGVPIGTVKSRLFLARAHLQNAVRQYLGVEAPQ